MMKTIIAILAFSCSFYSLADTGKVLAEETSHPKTAMMDNNDFIRMADNFFIFYDPSTAMDTRYKNTGLTRLEIEKKIIRESNAQLPELGWQTGLYPSWKGGLWLHGSPMAFDPFFPLGTYDREKYGMAIEELPVQPTGPPMLQVALMKLDHLLNINGRTEVFLFSDGNHSTAVGLEPEPLAQAKKLAKQYDVCFTLISSATGNEEQKLLADIALVNSCSQVVAFDTVADKPEHLLAKLYMKNNIFGNVLFDFDKSAIKEEFRTILDRLGQFLLAHPNTYCVLSGFTDGMGTEKYNVGLSKRRAERIQNYLRTNFTIAPERILPYWYGAGSPVADNRTEEGRRQNRRVTIAIRSQGPDH